MNNDLHVTHTPDARRWRMATRAVVGGVVLVWLAAALMVWSLVPQLVANDPSLVGSAADVFTALSIVALVVCVSGAAMLGGLAIVWRAPERAVGRVIMLLSGLVATTFGLLLLNGSTLQTSPEFRWDGTVALTLGLVTGTFIAVGLLAVAAAISRLLPGQSIAERMMLKERTGHARPGWGAMLVLTATLIVTWVVLANASLASHTLYPFLGLQFGMPVLAGGVLSGWRSGDPNRLKTLGWASLAGTASSFLFLLTLIFGNYYRFNPVGYFVWWGLIGALCGALGFGIWQLVTLRPRAAHAQGGMPA
jgi:hypothetical protein